MRLSLLRSPIAPDPDADRGEHRFTYSILPFTGNFSASGVIASAYELNSPSSTEISTDVDLALMKVSFAGNAGSACPGSYSLCSVDNSAVIIESVNAPECGDRVQKTLVLRLYESRGGHCRGTLHFADTLVSACVTDMLEDNPAVLAVNGNDLSLDFRPFEIKTIKVSFK
jgi:alpha-mannosidase